MIYIYLNLGAILLASVAGLAVDYGYRAAFGAGVRRAPAYIAIAFTAEAWFAAILAGALIVAPPKADIWTMTIGTALIIWGGFVAPVTLVTLTGRGERIGPTLAECGHWLLVVLAQAVVLRLVGLFPPPHG